MENVNLYWIFLGLIVPYILTEFVLVKKFTIFKKKIETIKNIRWGESNKSHLGGVVFFSNFLIIFVYFFYTNNIWDISNIDSEEKKILGLCFAILVGFIAGILDEIEVLPPFTKNTSTVSFINIFYLGKNNHKFLRNFFYRCFNYYFISNISYQHY